MDADSRLPGQVHGQEALNHLQQAMEEKGPALAEILAQAVRDLVRFRDALIERRRAEGHRPDAVLDRVNSILSLAYGAAYPIVGVRRARIEKTRDSLAMLLAEVDGNRTHHPR